MKKNSLKNLLKESWDFYVKLEEQRIMNSLH